MSSNESIRENGTSHPAVCLITTIWNEAGQLPELLESIGQQTLLPEEIIVVDGGSTDESLSILEQWQRCLPLTVIEHQGATISQGRNIALNHARAGIIAITDAGVRLDPEWLERLVTPFSQELLPVDVVAGFFEPDPWTEFETVLAASTLPDVEEIDPETFLPSSRSVAFRKSWFDAGIQYPEWLDYCEDLIFDLRMRRAGARFLFQPDAVARFRPRPSLNGFWWQYYRYARGDGKAGLFTRRHLARYLTYFVLVPSFLVTTSGLWRGLVLLGALGYMRQLVRRLLRRRESRYRLPSRIVMSAALRAFGDLAKMAGYPAGLLWRARRYGLRKNWRSIPEDVDRRR